MSKNANHNLKLVPSSSVSIPKPDGSDARETVATPGDSPDVVFIVDNDGTVLYVNRSLPTRSQDDVLGTTLYDYVLPNHHSSVRAGIERVFATGSPDGFEILGMAHRNSDCWYDCRVVPTKRAEKVVSATIIARDVTIRKRVEGELRRELEQLRQVMAERSEGLDQARQELSERAGAIADLEDELTRRSTELADARRDLEAKGDGSEEIRRQLLTTTQELDEAKQQLENRAVELRRAEEALAGRTNDMVRREFELARFREVVDEAGEAIFVIDTITGKFVDANDTACRWLSLDYERVVGTHADEFNLRFPVEIPLDFGDHVADTRDHRRPQYFSGEHIRLDGSKFPVEVGITHHAFGDKPYALIVARDAKGRQIVEEKLRETEDKYRALFELSRDAIYLSNRDGSIAEVNDSTIEQFGYSRLEFDGFPARRLYRDPQDIREFQRGVANHGFVRDLPLEFVRKDGSVFSGLLTATLRHGGAGSVLGYQCVIREVSIAQSAGPPSRRNLEEMEARGHGTVLLIERDDTVRNEVKHVLELAGVKVLVGESLSEALVVFSSRSREIGAVILDGDPREITDDEAFTEIRRVRPGTRIVLLTEEDSEQRAVEYLATAGLVGIVQKPFHPLALIQQVRDALDVGNQSPAGDAEPWKPRSTSAYPLREERQQRQRD